jgi:hypothetical protein
VVAARNRASTTSAPAANAAITRMVRNSTHSSSAFEALDLQENPVNVGTCAR